MMMMMMMLRNKMEITWNIKNHMKQDHEKVTTLNLARQRLTCDFQSIIILALTNRRSFTILPASIAHVFNTTVQVSLSGITLQLVDVIFEKNA